MREASNSHSGWAWGFGHKVREEGRAGKKSETFSTVQAASKSYHTTLPFPRYWEVSNLFGSHESQGEETFNIQGPSSLVCQMWVFLSWSLGIDAKKKKAG